MNNQNPTNEVIFVTASREKYRFESSRGQLNTEDLWSLSLEDLDRVAVQLDEKIQKLGRKSFIGKRTNEAEEEKNKLDIVTYVIDIKQTEAEAKKARVAALNQKKFLKDLLEKKRMQSLENLSEEEISKQIAALEAA